MILGFRYILIIVIFLYPILYYFFMINKELEEALCKDASERTGIDIKVVRRMRQIGIGEAIQRFLPDDVKVRLLEKRDYVLNPETNNDRMINMGFGLSRIGNYRCDFYESKEGMEWYESRCKTHNSMAIIALHIDADCKREYDKRQKGEARTRARLRRHGARWSG
jgi:hypothetical protein